MATFITKRANQKFHIQEAMNAYRIIKDEEHLYDCICEIGRYFLIQSGLEGVVLSLEELIDLKFTRMVKHLLDNGSSFQSIDYPFMSILLEEYFIDLANRASVRLVMEEEQTDAFVLAVANIVTDQEMES